MVKQDLAEFVSTIQQDTSTVVADTATAVKESLKVLDIKHPLYMQFSAMSTTHCKCKSNNYDLL